MAYSESLREGSPNRDRAPVQMLDAILIFYIDAPGYGSIGAVDCPIDQAWQPAEKLICENGPYKLVGANKLFGGFKAMASLFSKTHFWLKPPAAHNAPRPR